MNNLKDMIETRDSYKVDLKARAEEEGFPDAPFFLSFEQSRMPRVIFQTTTSRGILYYTLQMSRIGELRMVQIKESEVPKYAGWVRPR